MMNEKILSQLKGLSAHLQPDEVPEFSVPAIWDGGQGGHSETCDVVLTNQRLLGYYFRTFPREKLFLDALTLSKITNVTFRQKTYEPIFRELMITEGKRKVYIRTPQKKSEALYSALRSALGTTADTAEVEAEEEGETAAPPPRPAPVYGRQDIRQKFDTSPLAIVILFAGGIFLEIIGALFWMASHNSQIGLPLCIAGFLAVIVSILVQRQRSS